MKAIIQHLRFPFSLLLMPVFLFSLNCVDVLETNIPNLGLLFLILHLLVYPSSNAYNSVQDKDEGSIGLIKKPLPVPRNLFFITMILDIIAIILCLEINLLTAVLVSIYIIASRLYSWRKVRLKKYPMIGFLTVFICQGALIFFIVQFAGNESFSKHFKSTNILDFVINIQFRKHLLLSFVASLFIGSVYPLSQIYQHEQDKNDGVQTISAKLGYKNTFIFSGLQFITASGIISFIFVSFHQWNDFYIYTISQIPVILFFIYWFYKVMIDNSEANFKNTMTMNLISALCMNICFILLLLY